MKSIEEKYREAVLEADREKFEAEKSNDSNISLIEQTMLSSCIMIDLSTINAANALIV